MLYAILSVGITLAITIAIVGYVANVRSPANGLFASVQVFASTIAEGLLWFASFLACAVVVIGLIAALEGLNLEQVFSLAGSGAALVARYAGLVLAIGIGLACLGSAFVFATNLVRSDGFRPSGRFGNRLDAAPSWIQAWESNVAGPVREYMDRVRIAGL